MVVLRTRRERLMAEKRYNVVFSGKLVEGKRPPEVLARLCPLLELTEPEVRDMFKAGFGAVIVADVDGHRAYALREELREAGAICIVQEYEPPPQEPLSGSMQTVTPAPGRTAAPPWEARTTQPAMPAARSGGTGRLLAWLLLLAALAGGGWWGYRTWLMPASPAFQAYAAYAGALARGQYQQAAELATGEAKEYAEGLAWREVATGGELAWLKRKRRSEQPASDGDIALQVEQTVCRQPTGAAASKCTTPVTFRHDVEVRLVDGAWQVVTFKEERLTPP